jgi:hypothetical protein
MGSALYWFQKSMFFASGLLAQDDFEKEFGAAGIPAQNDTRWNSTLRQIQSVLSKGIGKLNSIAVNQKKPEVMFNAKEWEQLK